MMGGLIWLIVGEHSPRRQEGSATGARDRGHVPSAVRAQREMNADTLSSLSLLNKVRDGLQPSGGAAHI